jgi:hypothetical protein
VDVALVIARRLKSLGLEQTALAAAAQVTDSYVSQLLARKKAPPSPRRTDIYGRMEVFLRFPRGELARLAEVQRKEELKKKLADPAEPLFPQSRELLLRKCRRDSTAAVRAIFEKSPFGELERFVTHRLFEVTRTAVEEPKRKRRGLPGKEAAIEASVISWNMDLETFAMEIVLKSGPKRFEFAETQPAEPGFREFLKDKTLSGDATDDEIEFLKSLQLRGRRPVPIYYYRALQNLRDPVHFR